ncbi:GmrSD restriction endonuclease domain-containing protein [Candidatus Mycoplasma pogonae]
MNKKYWAIGTDIKTYIKRFEKIIDKNNLKEKKLDDLIFYFSSNYEMEKKLCKKDSHYYVIVNELENINQSIIETKNGCTSSATLGQMIKTWISLGFIYFENQNYKNLTVDEILKANYKINNNVKKYSTIGEFIVNHFEEKSAIILDDYFNHENNSNNEEEKELFSWRYNEEDKFFYSFLKAFYDKRHFPHNYNKNYWDLDLPNSDKISRYALKFCYGNSKKSFLENWSSKDDQKGLQFLTNFKIQKEVMKNNFPKLGVVVYNFSNFIYEYINGANFLKIPIYQRNYVWNEEIFLNLLKDINSFNDEEKYHFIGNITSIFKEDANSSSGGGETILIDGQQRLVTIMLILKAAQIYSLASDIKLNDYLGYIFYYGENKNSEKIANSIKYNKGNEDYSIFKNILLGKINEIKKDNTKNDSQIFKNFCLAFDYFIENNFTQLEMNKFINRLLTKFTFILNKHSDETKEFVLFQNLNTNKQELSNLDLIKNYIFMKIDYSNDDVKEKNIIEYFNKKIKFENKKKIDDFFKIYIKLFYLKNDSKIEKFKKGINSNLNIFNNLKNVIEIKIKKNFLKNSNEKLNYEEYKKIINDIGKYLNLYNNISKLITLKDNSEAPILSKIADIILITKRDVYFLPIIYLIDKYLVYDFNENKWKIDSNKINELRECLFAFERFEIILKITQNKGQSLTEFLDEITIKINNRYLNNESISYAEITKILENPSAENKFNKDYFEEFISNIETKSIEENDIVTRLCSRIEFYLENGKTLEWNNKDTSKDAIIKKPSREHILPSKYQEYWKENLKSWNKNGEKEMSDSDLEKKVGLYLNRIGNSIVINQASNSGIQNFSFYDKKIAYQKRNEIQKLKQYQGIEIEKKLTEIKNSINYNLELLSIHKQEKWTFKTIEKRSKQIALILKQIYKEFN